MDDNLGWPEHFKLYIDRLTDVWVAYEHIYVWYIYINTHTYVLIKIFLKIKAYYNRIGYWRENKMQLKIQRGKCSSVKFTTVKEQFFSICFSVSIEWHWCI